jgi:hypothetical protein
MAISLGLFVLFSIKDNEIMIKVMTMFFTVFFEISIGPILWLYLAEILTSKGISIAVFLNWAIVIAVSLATPYMVGWSKPGTFALYAGLCLLGGLFILIFMRETKGKTKDEISRLYAP